MNDNGKTLAEQLAAASKRIKELEAALDAREKLSTDAIGFTMHINEMISDPDTVAMHAAATISKEALSQADDLDATAGFFAGLMGRELANAFKRYKNN